MQKHRYLQAFELMTAVLSINRESVKKNLVHLKLIAREFDSYYEDNHFSQVMHFRFDSPAATSSIDEDLIIDYKKLNLKFSNIQIMAEEDRLLIYLCFTGWCKRIGGMQNEQKLAAKILNADENFVTVVDDFFNENLRENLIRGKYEMIMLTPVSEEETLEGDWIKSNFPKEYTDLGNFKYTQLLQPFKLLVLGNLKMFVITGTFGDAMLRKEGKKSICSWELIKPGDVIEIEQNIRIDYHDLKRRYIKYKFGPKLNLFARGVSFFHLPGKGVSQFKLEVSGGSLTGIIGMDGTGKSTVLKMLAGEILPVHGDILINGHSLKEELYHLKGMIGFVPEEDLLFNELTVAENLYYTARLHLGKLDRETVQGKVDELLKILDMTEIKNQVVGSIHNKNLQPGQRRLLNIALELIREPRILIVDNSLSPVSANDTAKILEILADYSFRGNIVITTITQTDKRTVHYFDNYFILDEGGFPVFFGKLEDAWDYFLELYRIDHPEMRKSDPLSLLSFISQRMHSVHDSINTRFRSPGELYSYYLDREKDKKNITEKTVLPENILSVPTLDRQFLIFSFRNFKTSVSMAKELAYLILLSPVLAIVFSFFMRNNVGGEYNFAGNTYIPSFFFISFILSVLMGLSVSANELNREKNIIHKDRYLNISFFSYINAKFVFLSLIVLIHSFIFILICHLVLEIRGLFLIHWFIFISCEVSGMLLGLILSGSHRSQENIYMRSIPLILLFHIFFGGGFIRFEHMPGKNKFTPLLAEMSSVKWAYEAIMVFQFRENAFSKPVYDFDRKIANGETYAFYIIPEMRSRIDYCSGHAKDQDSSGMYLRSLRSELINIARHFDVFPYENLNRIYPGKFNEIIAQDLNEYIEYLLLYFISLTDEAFLGKNNFLKYRTDSADNERLKLKYYNRSVEEVVTGKKVLPAFENTPSSIIQLKNAVYQYPESEYGRTLLFVPEKMIRRKLIDTPEFNISILWLMNLLFYVLLVFDAFNIAGIRMRYFARS